MQGKVSMVMPCYNKVKYIGEMFDSILAQDRDNIELILVNDGSTDGTREVIAAYEPKFLSRGFEVIIVDQKNAGVCASAKNGLERATGDYVCVVDSDDELDTKYVSTMAGWLDEHPEYDYCICDAVLYTGSGENKQFKPLYFSNISERETHYTERYLITNIRSEVWVYMVRADYIKKCRIIETYYTDTKGSHEPGFIIPLTTYNGLYKYFSLPLYHFNVSGQGHSRFERFEQAQKFYDEYDRLCKTAIDFLPDEIAGKKRKNNLTTASTVSKYTHLFFQTKDLPDGSEYANRIFNELLDSVNFLFSINPPITYEQVGGFEEIFIHAVYNFLLEHKGKAFTIPTGRIIGYGSLGKAANRLLPYLKGTSLEPIELWDMAGDGTIVKKPDFSVLGSNDLLLVFPLGAIETELKGNLPKKSFEVLYNSEIWDWLSDERFGELLSKGDK